MSSGQIRFGGGDFGHLSYGLLVTLAVLSGWASGCGQSTYAERVNRTAKVLAYHNRLDQNLQADWARGDWGVSMRPPVRFRLMPAPPPPKTTEEGVTEVIPDGRQPSYLGVELPGLVAAWEIPQEAFLYICSNHQRFIDSQGAASSGDPEAFFNDLEAILQQGFEVTLEADPARGPAELHRKFAERIPPSDEFAPPNNFQSLRIEKPTDPKFSANVWELTSGKIQLAVILVYSPTHPGNFENNVRIALETLRVDPTVPRAAAAPGTTPTPGAGPARQAF
jgi:hypothetical protein